MKKIILLIPVLLLQGLFLHAQIAYYDAFTLAEKTSNDTIGPEGAKILELYYKTGKSGSELIDTLNKVIGQNPFFKNDTVIEGPMSFGTGAQKVVGSIAGLDVTNFAYGMSDFLIERAKQELNIAFFQRFKDFLEKYPEAEILFPETSDFISNILAHEYTVWLNILREKFLEDIQNAPYQIDDIFNLPRYAQLREDIPELITCLQIIEGMQQTAKYIRDQQNPAVIIHNLANFEEWSSSNDTKIMNIQALFKTTDLLSQSLIFYDGDQTLSENESFSISQTSKGLVKEYIAPHVTDTLISWKLNSLTWVTPVHLKILLQDPVVLKIYMGLIYQQLQMSPVEFKSYEITRVLTADVILHKGDILLENSKLKSGDSMKTLPEDQPITEDTKIESGSIIRYKHPDQDLAGILSAKQNDLQQITDLMVALNALTTDYNAIYANIRNKRSKGIEIKKDDLAGYLNASGELLDFSYGAANYLGEEFGEAILPYKNIGTDMIGAINYIQQEKYADAMLSASEVFNELIKVIEKHQPESDSKASGEASPDYASLLAGYQEFTDLDKKEAKAELLKDYGITEKTESTKKVLKNMREFSSKLVQYGKFMGMLVDADSAAEVKAIIEATALPAGSSSLKKYSCNNVAINAYLGGGYGWGLKGRGTDTYFLYAPIGVAWTPVAMKKAGAFSIYGGLIDLGAVVNYRLTEGEEPDTVATNAKIVLGNIFSPGLGIVYGAPGNMPLSLSAGVQYTPGLAKITDSDLLHQESYWRIYATLTVDIPLYTIYSGRKKRK